MQLGIRKRTGRDTNDMSAITEAPTEDIGGGK